MTEAKSRNGRERAGEKVITCMLEDRSGELLEVSILRHNS